MVSSLTRFSFGVETGAGVSNKVFATLSGVTEFGYKGGSEVVARLRVSPLSGADRMERWSVSERAAFHLFLAVEDSNPTKFVGEVPSPESGGGRSDPSADKFNTMVLLTVTAKQSTLSPQWTQHPVVSGEIEFASLTPFFW